MAAGERQKFDPTQPYNSLPELPPEADLETPAVMRKCIQASRALAELKQASRLLPNPGVLINTIPLREARDSSAIENIVTTNDDLFRYAAVSEKTADPATKETHRYSRALWEGFQEVLKRPISAATAVSVCQKVKGVELDIRKLPGTNLTNDDTGEVIYTPPDGPDPLRALLYNWETFLHNDSDLDPLIRMAVSHYQFEAIHPFPDGNGRTGRILNILYLIDQDLLDIPVLYLSRYIIDYKEDYYQLLQGVTAKGEWEAWIIFMLEAVSTMATWTTHKIGGIKALFDETMSYVSKASPKTYSHELVELIFTHPYCRIGDVTEAGIAKRKTASVYLNQLVEIGVLQGRKLGREKIFLHEKFIRLLISDNNKFIPYDPPANVT